MDCFSRVNLYDVPCFIVFSFGCEIDITNTTICALSKNFYVIPIQYSERELWRFPCGHFFEMNFRSLQKHWLLQIISPKMLCTLIWNFCRSFLNISSLPHKSFSFWTFVEKKLERQCHNDLFQMNFRSLQKHWLPQIISPQLLYTLIWNFYKSFLKILDFPHKNFSFWNFVQKRLEWKYHDDLF